MRPRTALFASFVLLVSIAEARAADDEWEEEVDLDFYEPDEGDSTGYQIDDADLEQTVLIVELTGETAESAGVGVLLESYLRDSLEDIERYTLLTLDEAPPVQDTSADLYYRGCPPDNELGCQFVIGEVARVDRVVSGRVTVLSDADGARYRVVLTILNIQNAELEYSYALDLRAGEEGLLPATLTLALDRLQREQMLAPVRDEEERLRRRLRAMEDAATDEERRLVGRMTVATDWDAFARIDEERRAKEERVLTEADLEEQKGFEGRSTEWEDLGITEPQYLNYRNSRLEWEDWRKAWAGHRLMILGSVHGGFGGGALKQHYYGRYLADGSNVVVIDEERAQYGWMQPAAGGTGSFGFGLGVGILRNLDVEMSLFYLRTSLEVNGDTAATETIDGNIVARARDTSSWDEEYFEPIASLDMWGGDVMARFFILNMRVVRPTIGLGVAWLVYPDLFPDLEEGETPAIGSEFPRFDRLVDVGPQIEVGVAIDFHRNVGMFLRVPVMFGANPNRAAATAEGPPASLYMATTPEAPPFGVVRVIIGVQARVFGLPLQPKKRVLE
jgi:hypothetical protein